MIYECIKQYNDIPVGMFIEKLDGGKYLSVTLPDKSQKDIIQNDLLLDEYFKPVFYLRKYNIISEGNIVNAFFHMKNLPFVEYTCIKDFKGIKGGDQIIETDDYIKMYSEPDDDLQISDVNNIEYFKISFCRLECIKDFKGIKKGDICFRFIDYFKFPMDRNVNEYINLEYIKVGEYFKNV